VSALAFHLAQACCLTTGQANRARSRDASKAIRLIMELHRRARVIEMGTEVGVFVPWCCASVFSRGQLNPARSHRESRASAIEILGVSVQDLAGGWYASSRLACCRVAKSTRAILL